MKILIVIPYFAPAWAYGGPPKLMSEAASQLVARGHSVTVYTTDALDAAARVPVRKGMLNGVSVRYFANVSNRLAWQYKVFLPRGFAAAIRQTVAQFDVVHLCDLRTMQNWLAYRTALRAGVPYVLSAFGELPRATGIKRVLKWLYDLTGGYAQLRYASQAIAQTESEAQAYTQFGVSRGRIALVPLAIDMSEFESLPPRGTFRRAHGFPADAPLILFLGRIHAYKGLDLLLDAFAATARVVPEAQLAIVGRDDGYLTALQNHIVELNLAERVRFCGPAYGADRIAAYADADVFALTPSHAEETSLAALEACAAGTPVVVTRQAPIPWLDESEAGFTVSYEPAQVTDALRRLLTDAGLRARMGTNARRLAAARFDWPQVITQLENVYADAIGASQ
jgi:glycosyltransferase involved in cell wall biosynthesis